GSCIRPKLKEEREQTVDNRSKASRCQAPIIHLWCLILLTQWRMRPGRKMPSPCLRKGVKMLVLTRRLKEKIVFPSIPAEVQVLGIKGGQVRLGIEAPPQIAVVREELTGHPENETASETIWSAGPESAREFVHRLRNRLNDVGLNLAILR